MARYIDDILQPGEQVLYSTNAHWVVYLPAILLWIITLAFLILSRTTVNDTATMASLATAAVLALAAFYYTLKGWFHRLTTETDVTNRRVVHKTGFISRKTFEISLDKIESVDVIQSIPGRILNYGKVIIQGVGEGRQSIPMIASPLRFRNFITAR